MYVGDAIDVPGSSGVGTMNEGRDDVPPVPPLDAGHADMPDDMPDEMERDAGERRRGDAEVECVSDSECDFGEACSAGECD